MSTIPRLTMIGLYEYNDTLFDKMNLPAGINRTEFIDAFLLKYGECPVIYPNWGTMQFALGVWSKKWYQSIERIIRALTEEYNPLHNFDRHEEYSDTESKSETSEMSYDSGITETDTRKIDTDGTSTDEVSAFNEDTYQPDRKNTVDNTEAHSGSVETERSGSDTNEMTGSRDLTHTGHLYGNIGVTESTTMLMHEIDVRSNNNIIDIVADMLYKEICIYVY